MASWQVPGAKQYGGKRCREKEQPIKTQEVRRNPLQNCFISIHSCKQGWVPLRTVFILSKGEIPSDLIISTLPDLLKVSQSQHCPSGYPASSTWILSGTYTKHIQTLVPDQREAHFKNLSPQFLLSGYIPLPDNLTKRVFCFHTYFSPSHITMNKVVTSFWAYILKIPMPLWALVSAYYFQTN